MSTFNLGIFSDVSNKQLQRRSLTRGEILFDEGSTVESVFFIEKGSVRIVVEPRKGKRMVLYRARENEAVAEEHLVLDKYTYQAVADEITIVQFLPKQAILDDIRLSPEIAQRFIMCLSLRYYQLRINFERLGIRSAKDRVLHLLQTLSLQTQGPLDMGGRIKSFSDDLNLTHEATYRALKELEQEGSISREGAMIMLL